MFGGRVERAKDRRGTIRRLWGYIRRHRASLVLTLAMVVVSTGNGVLYPYLLGLAIDRYIVPGDLSGLLGVCLVLLAISGVSSLFAWLQSFVMIGVAQRTVRDIRDDLFGRLQRLPLRYLDERPRGDLMSRLTNDVENLNQILSDGLAHIVAGVLGMVGVGATMLVLNPRLTVVSVATISLSTFVLNRVVARPVREGFRRQQSTLGRLNGIIEETISGQRVVKAYHQEENAIREFGAANGKFRRAATRAQLLAGIVPPIMNFLNNLSLAVVAGVGGLMVVQGTATVGTIAAFINYTRQFGRPLNEIANLYNAIQSAIAGAERVFAVIDEPAEVDPPDAISLSEIRGEVVFDEVTFSYRPGVPVLKNVSLRASPGEVVALVGPTGAGKTTIVNLLTRFYEIDGGRVTVDGHDIREVRRDDLRRRLGIVLQDTYLFSGSVRENIRYGRLDATDEEVVAAARLANADQFIHRLPRGYDTPIAERGGNLSQGQRQLLAIARAILANPSILILDEATSSVDTRTEKHIQEAMLRLLAGRTSFVIAHRLSTIRDADQILVIDGGEIVERGTHDRLLAAGGPYARLYASQFRAVDRDRDERSASALVVGDGAPA